MAQPLPPTRLALVDRAVSSYPRPQGFPARITDEVYAIALRASLRGYKADYLSDVLGVAKHVVSDWMQSREWAKAAAHFRDDMRDVDLVACTAISSFAMRRVAERLEHGDAHVTKSGSVVYKPVNAADAASIALKFAERKDVLQRQVDGVPEPNDNDALENLFRVAAILTKAGEVAQRMAPTKVIDVTPEAQEPESVDFEGGE